MKTKLPTEIKTVEQAKAFLKELQLNNEAYHPEDNAYEIDWIAMNDKEAEPTKEECDQLNKLMDDIYSLPGKENYPNLKFDACEYLLEITKEKIQKPC